MPHAAFRLALPAAFAVMLFAPLLTDPYTQYMLNLILAYVVIAKGLNLLLGYAGQFAFANAAFMGLGAYTTALLMKRLDVPFLLALPASGVVAAVLGGLVALPAMRMRTVYLALVSLAFAELVQWVFIQWKPVTLGTDGVSVPWPTLFGHTVRGDRGIYFIIVTVAFAMLFAAQRLLQSRIGRALVAIRESETVAQCNGVNVARTKLIAFCLSAFYAGIGGSLFALGLRFIVPDGFGLFQLTLHFSIVLIGGLGSFMGSIIGAALLTALPELLRGVQWLQEILYGVLLIVFILFMPQGIAGFLKQRGWLPREILVRGWRESARDAERR